MKIAVVATDGQWKELNETIVNADIIRTDSFRDTADAYILLDEIDADILLKLQKPVLLNSVIHTLATLETGNNIVRINGWNGFLQRKIWEVAGKVTDDIKAIFDVMGKQYIEVGDEPGLVAARSISMIVNEAYFALGEEVSTKDEIDIAMKLGTNYPLGPFQWADKIGLKNIYRLLAELNKTDKRYSPAPLLGKEASA